MKHFIILSGLLIISLAINAQYVYNIKADSVKITNCDSAELILENHTQGIPGFLFNTGNGRTIFKRGALKLTDTSYLVGGDTVKWKNNAWVQGGNAFGATGVLGTTDSNHLDLYTSNTPQTRLSKKGNLIVGTTTIDNSYKLQVNGTECINTYPRLPDGNRVHLNFQTGTSYDGSLGFNGHNMIFQTATRNTGFQFRFGGDTTILDTALAGHGGIKAFYIAGSPGASNISLYSPSNYIDFYGLQNVFTDATPVYLSSGGYNGMDGVVIQRNTRDTNRLDPLLSVKEFDTVVFRVLKNGNVGVGTTTPQAQLHTTGTVRFTGLISDTTQTRVLVSDASGNLFYRSASSLAENQILHSSLAVNGPIRAKQLTLTTKDWPDYVFDSAYLRMPLNEAGGLYPAEQTPARNSFGSQHSKRRRRRREHSGRTAEKDRRTDALHYFPAEGNGSDERRNQRTESPHKIEIAKLKFGITILLLIFTTAALGQSVSPAGTLSGYQRQTTARKDSALHAAERYLHAGHPIKAKDTLPATKKAMPRPAPVDSSAAPDPERFVPSLDHGSCKITFFVPLPRDSADYQAPHTPAPAPPPAAPAPRVPFLQIHGNVLYNLNYYSRIDTPYNEQNIYQHTVQTWLDILVKGEYPFRIYLTNHFSNSSLFRNYSDYNFSYNNNGFLQHIKDLLRQQLLRGMPGQRQLDSLQRALNADWHRLKGLDQWRPNVDPKQQMVEAREREVRKRLQGSDTSANTHPPMDGLDSIYASKAKDADSIRKEIAALQGLLQVAHQRTQTGTTGALAEIQQMNNPAELRKKMPALGLSDSSLPKGYKTLMAIKSFNIGRTVVNYSELSAKNISVNGVQAEYNPSSYYAFAAGSVDYRFRDFIVQQPNQPHQYLNIYRIGQGLKDGNSVILTYFMGRRQLYNAATGDTSTAQVPSSFLMGLTLEGNYHLTKNILFTGEIAKSSSPSYSDTAKGNSPGAQLFRMNDHSNEAWSAKVNAFFPATQTRIKAAYKHLAVNYQSFSIFTDGSAQSAWSARVNQLFFKKQLDVTAGANTNDFSNPLIGQEYKSTTVFKSLQRQRSGERTGRSSRWVISRAARSLSWATASTSRTCSIRSSGT
ncbi:hypothetical protein ACQ86N_41255 [Puia sp. P3]|uniref:hypothetical protein n=1 Tax=Puia sp. P3 TaxID=3423952 RepID=UPI003D67221C